VPDPGGFSVHIGRPVAVKRRVGSSCGISSPVCNTAAEALSLLGFGAVVLMMKVDVFAFL
jgi:hypothetical protein